MDWLDLIQIDDKPNVFEYVIYLKSVTTYNNLLKFNDK